MSPGATKRVHRCDVPTLLRSPATPPLTRGRGWWTAGKARTAKLRDSPHSPTDAGVRLESSEEGAHQDYQAGAAHQLWLRATPPHAWECSCTTPERTTARMCGPHAPPALLGPNRLEKHNSAKSENINIKRGNAKLNMHMRKLRVALRACGTPPGHAAWAHIPRSAGQGLHARNTTSAAEHTKLPNKASTSPEPHGTNQLRKSQPRAPEPPATTATQKDSGGHAVLRERDRGGEHAAAPRERPKKKRPATNPLHPNRLPPQPPRRTARSMRCCGCTMG